MRTMQRVSCLEGDNVFKSTCFEAAASLCWSQTEFSKIKMDRQPQDFQLTGNVSRSPAMHFGDEWVARVLGTKNLACGFREIPFINLFHRHRGDNIVSGITQRHLAI